MSSLSSSRHEITPAVRRGIMRWIVKAELGVVLYAAVLFVPAGTLRWPWAWAYLGLMLALLAAHPLLLVPINPELLAEREKGMWDRGVKWWDKWLTFVAGGLMFAPWVVAGLDVRWHWTGALPLAIHLAGVLILVAGDALFMWAMVANAFFAEGVRIQEERGHAVAKGGPYRYVRHPGYVGAILQQLGAPLVLGSLWALIPAVLCGAVFVVRTSLEDRTLRAELPGYETFAGETRYRLVPGVW